MLFILPSTLGATSILLFIPACFLLSTLKTCDAAALRADSEWRSGNWGSDADVQKVDLRGGGSTIASRTFLSWMAAYRSARAQFVDLHMTYNALGSGWGQTAIMGDPDESKISVEYGVSDSYLTDDMYQKEPDLQLIPCLAGALVLGYNVPGVKDLILTRDQLAGIYNGTHQWWDDVTFKAYNPQAEFPHAPIIPVARYDSSGSTYVFTQALSSFSINWSNSYGAFSVRTGWNSNVVRTYGMRSSGVADMILNTVNSVGYLAPDSAKEVSLPYARLVNKAGLVVDELHTQLTMEYEGTALTDRMNGSLVDSAGVGSYPLAAYSYMIIHKTTMKDCTVAVELARFIEWMAFSHLAALEATNAFVVPITETLANKIRTVVINQMKCEDGKSVEKLLNRQKDDEAESLKSWKKPVIIVGTLLAVLVVVLLGLVLGQRIKYLRMLNKDDWKIDYYQVELFLPKFHQGRRSIAGDLFKACGGCNDQKLSMNGKWQSHKVTLCPVLMPCMSELDKKVARSFMYLRESVLHENVVRFFGISQSATATFYVREYCEKGNLHDLFKSKAYKQSESLSYAIAEDVVSGMAFLHKLNIVHGNLRTSCCLVDSKWCVKVTDWERNYLRDRMVTDRFRKFSVIFPANFSDPRNGTADIERSYHMLWNPPEAVKQLDSYCPTKSGDVYSFSLIMYEIFTGSDPCSLCLATDVKAEKGYASSPISANHRLNSTQQMEGLPAKARQIITMAWQDSSVQRPSFEHLGMVIRAANSSGKQNVIDNVVEKMEDYIRDLEEKLAKRDG